MHHHLIINEKTKRVVVRRDVLFNETDFGLGTDAKTKEVLEVDGAVDPVTTTNESSETEPRYSERTRRPVLRFGIDE